MPGVPAKPEGDPDGMEEMATACREAAKSLGEAARTAKWQVDSMEFQAPVASRIRGRVGGNCLAQVRVGADLTSFAKSLEEAATELRGALAAHAAAVEAHNEAVKHNSLVDAAGPNPLMPAGSIFP